MDEFLDKSDELRIEILSLLEGVPAFTGIRFAGRISRCSMALEHALSLRLRVRTSCYMTAL